MNKSKNRRKIKKQNKTKKQKKIKGGNFNYFCIVIIDNKNVIDDNRNIIINLFSSKKESYHRPIAYVYLNKMSENTIKIEDFQVYNENNRNKKYGSSLMKYTINFIKQNTNYKKIIGDLSPTDDIKKLIRFYPRFGFKIKEKNNDLTIKLNIQKIHNLENITFTDGNTLILTNKENEKYDYDSESGNSISSSDGIKSPPLLSISKVISPSEQKRIARAERFGCKNSIISSDGIKSPI